jgi:chaperone BCS1
MDEAIDYAEEKETERMKVFQVTKWGRSWEECLQKKPRSIDSVILDGNIAEEVIADIKRFQNATQWYADKGVPYRRGYLFYGPPGTGKTSFT